MASINDSSVTNCKILPSSNSTFSIAQHWDNIPETLLLNGAIGFVLYILFLLMTKCAWNQTYNDDSYINQGLLSFLYGYRDPDRWYVIPRYEFLRQQDSHHAHDLDYPNIYVPPKLPLANPIELFTYDSRLDNSTSTDEASSRGSQQRQNVALNDTHQHQHAANFLRRSLKDDSTSAENSNKPATTPISGTHKPDSNSATSSSKSTIPIDMTAYKSSKSSLSQANGSKLAQSKLSPLGNSFFYPSILTAEQLQASYLSKKLNKFFSYFFKVTDADIIYAKGIDAYEYLLFQRHLIFIMVIVNVLCLGVIFPIHWSTNDNQTLEVSFQRSTIKNMSDNSTLYWAHVICSVLIVIVCVIVMNSYKESIITKDEPQLSRRTVLVGNIPPDQRNRHKLTEVIRQHFPDSTVEAVQFVYNIKLLEQHCMFLSALIEAKNYCFYYKHRYKREIMVKPSEVNEGQHCNGNCRLCSFFYVCCCLWPKESKLPGTEFYVHREQYYRSKITKLFKSMVKQPSDYAFVTLKSNKQARRIMEELARMKIEVFGDRMNDPFVLRSQSTSRRSPPRDHAAHPDHEVDRGPNGSSKSDQILSLPAMKGKSPASKHISEARHLESKYLQHSGVLDQDPLDIRNNPHVRSIRSPLKGAHNNTADQRSQPNGGQVEHEVANNHESDSIRNRLEGPVTWSIRYAPHPDNVDYADLLHVSTTSKYTIAFLHLVMIVLFIFVTTPSVLMSLWHKVANYESLFYNYITILLQIAMTALLPSLITLISKQIPYEDTASKDHSIMWKVYLFLVLMVVVMPSIGMSSAQAFLSSKIDYKCLFPADNGAYFVNYVVTSIFLSTVLELIKPTDVIFYCFILWTSRSAADFEGGRQYIEREFSVGMQHTSVLLIFSVVMTYTISCPLIAPVGLIYLIVKHAVDHYHLFYVYFTKKVDSGLQNTIVLFVRVALLLMLFQTMVALFIKTGTSYFSFTAQVILFVTSVVFLCNFFLYCTSRPDLEPRRGRFQHDFCACFYLPRVIEDLLRLDAVPPSCISRKI